MPVTNIIKMAYNTIYLNSDLAKVYQRCSVGGCRPSKTYIDGRNHWRREKELISEVGENGPTIDLLLRASITQMVVMHFASDSRQIKKEGLNKHANWKFSWNCKPSSLHVEKRRINFTTQLSYEVIIISIVHAFECALKTLVSNIFIYLYICNKFTDIIMIILTVL